VRAQTKEELITAVGIQPLSRFRNEVASFARG
jgi:hypothetical protein